MSDFVICVASPNHSIWFHPYDIDRIRKLEDADPLKIFVPECSARDCFGKTCPHAEEFSEHNKEAHRLCVKCNEPHIEEIYLHGFTVSLDGYIAELQTGICVPVSEELYKAWNKHSYYSLPTSRGVYYIKTSDLINA